MNPPSVTFDVHFLDSWFPLILHFPSFTYFYQGDQNALWLLRGFSEQRELAISFSAFIHTLLPAALVILFNKHICHISLLLKSSCGFPSCWEETPSPSDCLRGPSGAVLGVPDAAPSLWALLSCLVYAVPAPPAPWRHFIPWRTCPLLGHDTYALVLSDLSSNAHFQKDLPIALHKPPNCHALSPVT